MVYSKEELQCHQQFDTNNPQTMRRVIGQLLESDLIEVSPHLKAHNYHYLVSLSVANESTKLQVWFNGDGMITAFVETSGDARIRAHLREVIRTNGHKLFTFWRLPQERPERMGWREVPASKGQSSGMYAGRPREERPDVQAEKQFYDWLLARLPAEHVCWMNEEREQGESYDFELSGPVFLEVKSTRGIKEELGLTSGEAKVMRANPGRYFAVVVELPPEPRHLFYVPEGSVFRLLTEEEFLAIVRHHLSPIASLDEPRRARFFRLFIDSVWASRRQIRT